MPPTPFYFDYKDYVVKPTLFHYVALRAAGVFSPTAFLIRHEKEY
jgi:hypothetical protein